MPGQPFKYLLSYPFAVLAVAKAHNVVQIFVSLYCWSIQLPSSSIFLVILVPIADICSFGISVISLWFMLQKFYWKKLEIIFDVLACALAFSSLVTAVVHPAMSFTFIVSHALTIVVWMFCIAWTSFYTDNTVSNLFIAHWGEATTDIEIQALSDHF